MATTTPNYGWPVPTSTDLVKDGAVAIESLGDAADATMATMVPKSIVDAKGDIIAATAADTVSRLAVGANNTVLTADSSAATGLKWATPAGGGKVLQVVNATQSNAITSSTDTWVDTNLTATITPSATTSKILVIADQNGCGKGINASASLQVRLLRGSTALLVMEEAGGYTNTVTYNFIGTIGTSYLDSPATTSATTYKLQLRSSNNNASAYIGQGGVALSTITLLEIGA
jgi:hypothetical protein